MKMLNLWGWYFWETSRNRRGFIKWIRGHANPIARQFKNQKFDKDVSGGGSYHLDLFKCTGIMGGRLSTINSHNLQF